MNRDELFLRTLDDLEKRVEPGIDEYEVLMSAGLLRKLLLDDPPLADQVNRERKLRILYRINASGPDPAVLQDKPLYWSMQDGLDPEDAVWAVPKDVGRDELLAAVIALIRGRDITVRDTILHTANVVGAVHPGEPKSKRREVSELLAEMSSQLQIGGYSPDIRALQAVGRIVLRVLHRSEKKSNASME
jgi:hypothetical protein